MLILILIISFSGFSVKAQTQETIYSFGVKAVQRGWKQSNLEGRSVIFTDKKNKPNTVFIDIPQDGYYQLMVSIYHRWRKYCPFLYFKIRDSKGNCFSGYIFSEQRFYLAPGKGRWEYRSPSAAPFWYLHEGQAKIKFWVDAKNNCWEKKDVSMEEVIFLEKILLIPIQMDLMRQLSVQDENNIND